MNPIEKILSKATDEELNTIETQPEFIVCGKSIYYWARKEKERRNHHVDR